MLNYIWAFFFIASFVAAVVTCILEGNLAIWSQMSNALFEAAKLGFEISIYLTGMLCFWLGMLKIAEKSKITDGLARILYPLFKKIMPEIPEKSPAFGSIVMNIAANILGLDNAATPMGLKAMEQLQAENKSKTSASNAQILFMVINSSSVTLIPITILMYRSQLGSSNPGLVFIPILLATSISTLVGFLSVAAVQRLNIFNRIVLVYGIVLGGLIALLGTGFALLGAEARAAMSSGLGNFILIFAVFCFITIGLCRKIKVYDEFITGAKDGFNIAVSIIPYLVAMLAAIALFRSSGALDLLISGIKELCSAFSLDTEFVPALPTVLLKPLSGSGARAMMIETMQSYGVDSFPAFVSAVVQGSTETTFYVLAVYFGAVKITNTRHALPCALLADLAGVVAAIVLSYLFYMG
ncbi:MAG: nucleoside recognition domain-containing protein [Rhodospirillales bacterium]|nr:nucleoside recognition domain-containing protein [Rhodospirillales bacterium]